MTNKTIIDKLDEYKKKASEMGIEQLKQEVSYFAQKKEEECYDNGGHKPKEGQEYKSTCFENGKIRVYEFCNRCKMSYRREPTPEERKEFYNIIKVSFDI